VIDDSGFILRFPLEVLLWSETVERIGGAFARSLKRWPSGDADPLTTAVPHAP
jgi:hypothetical protein